MQGRTTSNEPGRLLAVFNKTQDLVELDLGHLGTDEGVGIERVAHRDGVGGLGE